MDEMINNAEEFYQSLGVAYHIVNIVSGKVYCVCMYMYVYVCVCVRERERLVRVHMYNHVCLCRLMTLCIRVCIHNVMRCTIII